MELKDIGWICNVPWLNGMIADAGEKEFLSKTFPSCNSIYEYDFSDASIRNFAAQAANYGHASCIGNFKLIILNCK